MSANIPEAFHEILTDKAMMQVPVKGQALLDYARQDKVFRQLRLTAWPDSQDAQMMAGAHNLLLIYRKFVSDRTERERTAGRRKGHYSWTLDMNSEVRFRFGLDHTVSESMLKFFCEK